MTPAQQRDARKIIRGLCSNCVNGNCIRLDQGEEVPCPQMFSASVCCRFFRNVLLKDPEVGTLEAEIFSSGTRKRCAVCGKIFCAKGNRAKYCTACKVVAQRQQQAEYLNNPPDSSLYRNKQGGNILFRPVALIPFVKAAVKVASEKQKPFSEVFADLPISLLSINNPIWRNVIWNNEKGTMIVNNQKLTERILLFYWDKSLLTEKKIATMRLDMKSLRQITDEADIDSLLDDALEYS